MRSVESEAPITAAKAKKVPRAAAADIRSIRNEKKKMKASGASATTHISGVPYSVAPNWVRLTPPMRATACGRVARRGQHVDAERDQGRDGQTQDHVVVDAEHEGAQALVDLSLPSGQSRCHRRFGFAHTVASESFLAVSRLFPRKADGSPPPPHDSATRKI